MMIRMIMNGPPRAWARRQAPRESADLAHYRRGVTQFTSVGRRGTGPLDSAPFDRASTALGIGRPDKNSREGRKGRGGQRLIWIGGPAKPRGNGGSGLGRATACMPRIAPRRRQVFDKS